MTPLTRNIVLALVLVLIIGSVVYLDSLNAHHATVAVGNDTVTAPANAPHSANYDSIKNTYPPAKELVSPDGFINTGGQPLTISSLIGKKVILVDFWTYSCINCQRAIPYLEGWYKKYGNDGFVVIGVHTPEFAFEKVLANVQAAVTKFGITYPVVLDSNNNTWDAYGNNYWPEEYLIDINGLVREHNIGEGNYAETEKNIQDLLAERNQALGLTTPIPTGTLDITQTIDTNSPETYFNSTRDQYLQNGAQLTAGKETYTAPGGYPPLNSYYLSGTWNITDQFAESESDNATITYTYDAQDVYFVASANPGVTVTVLEDGKPLTTQRGDDVNAQSQVSIGQPRLYTLIHHTTAAEHTITIQVHGTGLNAFTFTFG